MLPAHNDDFVGTDAGGNLNIVSRNLSQGHFTLESL